MLVCICNAIKESELKEAVRGGATTPGQAFAAIGRKPKCGQCVSHARTLIRGEAASS